MIVLGLSCYYHDSAAVLLRDGVIVAAAQEERFNRDKYSPVFPIQSINWCLQEAGITIYDVDEVAFYEKMYLKFERTILSHVAGWPFTFRSFLDTMPLWLKDRLTVGFAIDEELCFRKPPRYVKHHLSHAASAFYVSPFERAAVLTVDGVGEWATATLGVASGTDIRITREMRYPHSLGLLYSIVTAYLGFRVFSGEGKVMALAELGAPTYLDAFRKLVDLRDDGSFRLVPEYFSFNRGERMHTPAFEALLGPARAEGAELTQRHLDIAASLQRTTEEVLLRMARHLHRETGETNLCLAGGVFQNVTANARLRDEGPFERIFVQPAVGDAGAALGAALFVHHGLHKAPRGAVMDTCALGPAYTDRQIEVLLRNRRAKWRKLGRDELVAETADRLAEGKVVAWFQGRMEYGPRALGNRSILAHPGLPDMRDRLNARVKHREAFRPFGASVLLHHMEDWFLDAGESPFMLFVQRIRPEQLDRIPAVAHANGTSRVQTVTPASDPLYHALIDAFRERTGIPMLVNTSFNDDEPIVCRPEDAWRCWESTAIDRLVLGSYVVER